MKLKEFKKAVLIWGVLNARGLTKIKQSVELVIVPENRPYLLGLKCNIPLLQTVGIPYFYCTDNMLGGLFYKNKIQRTFLFYKKETTEGVVGFCGSLYVALLSKLHGVSISAFLGREFNLKEKDENASILGGKEFVQEDNRKWVEAPEDEIINREVLGWDILPRKKK